MSWEASYLSKRKAWLFWCFLLKMWRSGGYGPDQHRYRGSKCKLRSIGSERGCLGPWGSWWEGRERAKPEPELPGAQGRPTRWWLRQLRWESKATHSGLRALLIGYSKIVLVFFHAILSPFWHHRCPGRVKSSTSWHYFSTVHPLGSSA